MDEPPRDNCVAINTLVIIIFNLFCGINDYKIKSTLPKLCKKIVGAVRQIHSPYMAVSLRI